MKLHERSLLILILLLLCGLVAREGYYYQEQRRLPVGMVVSVSGPVVRPGVVQLPAGARAVHAITLCGGLAAGADLEAIPLARALKDGEHLIVPRRVAGSPPLETSWADQDVKPAPSSSWTPRSGSAGPERVETPDRDLTASSTRNLASKTPRKKSRTGPPEQPIDLNRASIEELDTLPGIGPVTARRIVEAREKMPGGTFGSLEELRAIRGIKAKTFLRLKPYLKIEGS